MTTKIKPVDQSFRPGYDSQDDSKDRHGSKKKKSASSSIGPAVVNHIIDRHAQMKQLQLPFEGNNLGFDLKVFELYMYRDPRARYKSYGVHVEYTLAKNMNQAEELFSKTYPTWWKTMGVKETTPEDVAKKLDLLKEQVSTCKFVLQALNINQ